MMELLKRFEEDTLEEGVDDNEEDEFSRRFEDMDLGKYLNLCN